jgi:hypothetical protein
MSILSLLLLVCLLGFLCWLVSVVPQIPPVFKTILIGSACFLLFLVVVHFFVNLLGYGNFLPGLNK